MVNNQRGMVLLLVLVVIVLLSALLSEFVFSTLVDMRLTETFRDATRAEYLARGGIKAGRKLLQVDRNGYDAREPAELWSVGVQNYPVAEGRLSVTIEDLDGRLPLNQLIDPAGNLNLAYRQRFVRLCTELALDNPEALADALIDWLDPDHEPGPAGAEDADYRQQSPPYEASDGPLLSLDELQLVRGFSAATVARLRPHVTSFGSGRLNINTASPEVLRSWDADAVPAIDSLLSRRAEQPYRHLSELRDTIGIEDFTALNRLLDLSVSSSYYRINSQGWINDGSRRMLAIIEKTSDRLLWQKVN